jgi:hypothetical protein
MDSSDIIARRKAMTIYTDLIAKFKAENLSGDCEKVCNCTSKSCIMKFKSYEEKQVFKDGSKICPCAPEDE